jgi:hypothetical protein
MRATAARREHQHCGARWRVAWRQHKALVLQMAALIPRPRLPWPAPRGGVVHARSVARLAPEASRPAPEAGRGEASGAPDGGPRRAGVWKEPCDAPAHAAGPGGGPRPDEVGWAEGAAGESEGGGGAPGDGSGWVGVVVG